MNNIHKYTQTLGEQTIYVSSSSDIIQQRFNLRDAGSQIAQPIVSEIIMSWNMNRGKVNSCANYDSIDFLYTDKLSSRNDKVLIKPCGEYFDALPDIDFDIIAVM